MQMHLTPTVGRSEWVNSISAEFESQGKRLNAEAFSASPRLGG